VNLPPFNHVIYIPLMLLIGIAIGWAVGTRSVRNEWDRAEKRRQKQEEA
jgi:PHP family Zn ribbon phosphoesterase